MTQAPTDPTATQPAARPPAFTPLSIAAAVVAAAAGPFLWVGLYTSVGAIWLAPLLIGVLVGLAVRFTSRGPDARLSWLAAGLTALSCFAGYVWTDLAFIKWIDAAGNPVQPAFADAARRFLNDLFVILLVAIASYLAFTVSRRGG